MNRLRAKNIFYNVVIGATTFFILETSWIPPNVKVVMSFVGGIAIGAFAQEDSARFWESERTIKRVQDHLNKQLAEQKTVTVVRLLTLLEEMKDKN